MSSLVSDEHDSFGRDDDRQLCPDSACIGILNEEGVCPECGSIADSKAAVSASAGEPAAVDLLYRKLCRDGACIGILGPDGRCRECGLVGEEVTRDPRLRGLKAEEDQQEQAIRTPAPPLASAPADGAMSAAANDEPVEFSNRRLCPDGGCIGVIGTAGNCNECGLVA